MILPPDTEALERDLVAPPRPTAIAPTAIATGIPLLVIFHGQFLLLFLLLLTNPRRGRGFISFLPPRGLLQFAKALELRRRTGMMRLMGRGAPDAYHLRFPVRLDAHCVIRSPAGIRK